MIRTIEQNSRMKRSSVATPLFSMTGLLHSIQAVIADEALARIDEKRYDAEMKEDGIQDILKFGIAFSGKKASKQNKIVMNVVKVVV